MPTLGPWHKSKYATEEGFCLLSVCGVYRNMEALLYFSHTKLTAWVLECLCLVYCHLRVNFLLWLTLGIHLKKIITPAKGLDSFLSIEGQEWKNYTMSFLNNNDKLDTRLDQQAAVLFSKSSVFLSDLKNFSTLFYMSVTLLPLYFIASDRTLEEGLWESPKGWLSAPH